MGSGILAGCRKETLLQVFTGGDGVELEVVPREIRKAVLLNRSRPPNSLRAIASKTYNRILSNCVPVKSISYECQVV